MIDEKLNAFIQQLKEIVFELRPLTEQRMSDSLAWNGEAYTAASPKSADPHALAWWSTLNTVAALLNAQECPLSDGQMSYLEKLLFGGMGSLNDLYLNENRIEAANGVNHRLDEKRRLLFQRFQALRVPPS